MKRSKRLNNSSFEFELFSNKISTVTYMTVNEKMFSFLFQSQGLQMFIMEIILKLIITMEIHSFHNIQFDENFYLECRDFRPKFSTQLISESNTAKAIWQIRQLHIGSLSDSVLLRLIQFCCCWLCSMYTSTEIAHFDANGAWFKRNSNDLFFFFSKIIGPKILSRCYGIKTIATMSIFRSDFFFDFSREFSACATYADFEIKGLKFDWF